MLYNDEMISGVVKRNKEDLHEWTIYRQNLTSSLANSLLLPEYVGFNVRTLTYGDFRMNDGAVEGVLRAGRMEDNQLSQKADTYLKFGLPRVAIDGQSGNYTLQRSLVFRTNEKTLENRRSRSEWDLTGHRNAEVDGTIGEECATLRDGLTSVPSTPTAHYAESDIFPSVGANRSSSFFQSDRHHRHYFSNMDLFQQPSGFNYLRYAKAEELRRDDCSRKPHVHVTNLTFKNERYSALDRMLFRTPQYERILNDISLELIGGEIVALLYTTEFEMQTLLHVLAQKTMPNGKLEGDFAINGNQVNAQQFGDRVALVDTHDLFPLLTVKETLKISSAFVKPATDAFKIDSMVDQLIQTLALSPYRNSLCEELGKTEIQRLKIAEQILKDTDILLCENITREMDVYDTAFVIDYLRDWAMKLNRIVLMAVAPPTIEILTMFHKAVLLASGQIIYFGRSSQMIDYFESVNFPCPMFKNPCDYYVDLVTHDHLTPEASVESMERIKHLSDIWRRKAYAREQLTMLEPISPKLRHSNCFTSALLIYLRFFRIFINGPWNYLREVILTLFISILLGTIFFEIPADRRASINDRFGFIFSILTIVLLPNILINIDGVYKDRRFLHNDLLNRYYDPTCYLLVKIVFDLPFALISYTLYTVPAYLLTNLPPSDADYWRSVLIFLTAIIIYNILWRYISWIFAFVFSSRTIAALMAVSLMSCCCLSSGLLVHSDDLSSAANRMRTINPTSSMAQMLAEYEFLHRSPLTDKIEEILFDRHQKNASEVIIGCERKKILATKIKEVPIYTVSQCSKIRGEQALYFSGFHSDSKDFNKRFTEFSQMFCVYFAIVFMLQLLTVRINHKPTSIDNI
uniref:ATP-binding cassette sub-family G member 8 n=3 Tax=Ascaris suum TaxID=6253 RepID=F1KW38_ASCSU